MEHKVTKLRVPPTKYAPSDSILAFAIYPATGGLALVLLDPEYGEENATATVNIESYGAPKLPLGEVWLKGWSENEGVPEALVQAGVIELTGDTYPTGYCKVQHAKLIGSARELALEFLGVNSPPEQKVDPTDQGQDLGDIIDAELFDDPRCFSDLGYIEWEREVAKPELEKQGYTNVEFFMVEKDSFGPLIRGVWCTNSDGVRVRFSYG